MGRSGFGVHGWLMALQRCRKLDASARRTLCSPSQRCHCSLHDAEELRSAAFQRSPSSLHFRTTSNLGSNIAFKLVFCVRSHQRRSRLAALPRYLELAALVGELRARRQRCFKLAVCVRPHQRRFQLAAFTRCLRLAALVGKLRTCRQRCFSLYAIIVVCLCLRAGCVWRAAVG